MTKRPSDRQMKIALLQAQAAVERELMLQYAAGVRQDVSRYTGFGQRLGSSGIISSALRVWLLALRHPVMASTASAWLLRGKKSRWLRLGGIALLGWRLFGAVRGR